MQKLRILLNLLINNIIHNIKYERFSIWERITLYMKLKGQQLVIFYVTSKKTLCSGRITNEFSVSYTASITCLPNNERWQDKMEKLYPGRLLSDSQILNSQQLFPNHLFI
ncbi:hypothetical protein L6164_009178 [Bauhinia variegata]|uniref:Uncharacterized protein n=1 Tax=Bauhinia variegata TaxID=167791 RepID=A0ACB9PPK0_BAUVA|nr:hypothetical protein L6164_009178 [Bauhinia variegata]